MLVEHSQVFRYYQEHDDHLLTQIPDSGSISKDVGYEIVNLTPMQLQGLAFGRQNRQILTKHSHDLMNSTNPSCPFCFESQDVARYEYVMCELQFRVGLR